MERVGLTDRMIAKLAYAATGDARYEIYDDEVPNFGVRVGQRTKTFILRRRAGGRAHLRSHTVGAFPQMGVDVARKLAGEWE